MNLSAAYTFDPELIRKLSEFHEVKEVYGKLRSDAIGGGRSSYMVRENDTELLRHAVKQAQVHRIKFNYLLNAANFDGMEQSRSGQRKIRKLLDFISDLGITDVTVSIPYLLKIIKSQYPHFSVRVGVFARVASEASALWWERMGADVICLSAIACNRNYELLRSIRNSVACDLQLIVNAYCLQDCPFELSHMNLLTRSSRDKDPLKRFCLDYCFLHCSAERYRNPELFLKSIWIRPEDCSLYEEIGYSNFKIIDRGCTADQIVTRVRAYAARTFNGNLMELIGPSARIKTNNESAFSRIRKRFPFFRPDRINLKTLVHANRFLDDVLVSDSAGKTEPVFIDNRSLDGYLASILKHNCVPRNCRSCSFCTEAYNKAVIINPEYYKRILKSILFLERGLNDGTHWLSKQRGEVYGRNRNQS